MDTQSFLRCPLQTGFALDLRIQALYDGVKKQNNNVMLKLSPSLAKEKQYNSLDYFFSCYNRYKPTVLHRRFY